MYQGDSLHSRWAQIHIKCLSRLSGSSTGNLASVEHPGMTANCWLHRHRETTDWLTTDSQRFISLNVKFNQPLWVITGWLKGWADNNIIIDIKSPYFVIEVNHFVPNKSPMSKECPSVFMAALWTTWQPSAFVMQKSRQWNNFIWKHINYIFKLINAANCCNTSNEQTSPRNL